MTSSLVLLLAVGGTVFVAAFLQAASGFGFSLIAVPVITVLVSAKSAVVGADVLAFALIVWLAVSQRRHVDQGVFRTATIAACIGVPIGLLTFTRANDRTLAIAIAVVVIALTVILISGFTLRSRTAYVAAAGFVSGVLVSTTGTNGPPLVLALHARDMPAAQFRATLAAAFAIQDLAAIGGFVVTNQFTTTVGAVVLAGLPGLAAGSLVGNRVFSAFDQTTFRRFVLGLLLVSGGLSLVVALRAA